MALQKQFDDIYGNTHASAYYRVCKLALDFANSTAIAIVYVYKDNAARIANKMPITKLNYNFNMSTFPQIFAATAMDTKNPIKGVYDEIKTYPEFSGATDV